MVIAFKKLDNTSTRKPRVFRSYHHSRKTSSILERNPGDADNYEIWKVGRATSAAPTYFKAMRLEDDKKSDYIDGMLL